MKDWIRKYFGPKPAPPPSTLYMAGEPVKAHTIQTLEAKVRHLERYLPLLKEKELLGGLVDELMGPVLTAMGDPMVVQESRQFYGGSLWLSKALGDKLDGLQWEIATKRKELFDMKKNQGGVFTPQGG